MGNSGEPSQQAEITERCEAAKHGTRRLRREWPPLLQAVVPLSARFTLQGTLRKPSVHACKLLEPPKFKHARAPRCRRLVETPGEMQPCGWPLKPGFCGPTPLKCPPSPRPERTPKALLLWGAEAGRNRRGRRLWAPKALKRAGWAPGAGRARGGDGAGRPGSRAGRPEGAAAEGRAGEGWGRRLQNPHAKKARSLVRPHSLTSPVHPAAHGCCPRDSYAKGYRAK